MSTNRSSSVTIWRIEDAWHPYPWRFSVSHAGKTHAFAGIPNQCATKREAAARAGWRLRWLRDGSFAQRYARSLDVAHAT